MPRQSVKKKYPAIEEDNLVEAFVQVYDVN